MQIEHLTGQYYVFTTYKMIDGGLFPANGMYLVTEEGAVLFDCPWDTTQTAPLLDSILTKHGKKVIACIATHSHADRTGSFACLKQLGVKTYATTTTDKQCILHKENRAEFLLDKDTVFSIGGCTFQTYYPGAGHTVDNIVVWFPERKILYGGCFIKSTEAANLGYIEEADLNAWPHSIENVLNKFGNPSFVIPGHQAWKSTRSVAHTLQLLKAAKRAKSQ